MRQSVFWDDEGFSTVGLAVALLVTLALLFTAAHVYEIQSAASDVQDVADAAVLAAENTVAEFLVVVQLCDAVVLSLSLGHLVILGLGLVTACIPPAKAFSVKFMEAAHKLAQARDSFSEHARSNLERYQRLLSFLAAADASSVMLANSGGSRHAEYLGLALLVPLDGEGLDALSFDESEEALDEADHGIEEIYDGADRAEELAYQASEAKERAWFHDCGRSPQYCMRERALNLAGLEGDANPFYASAETWDFSIALDRAKRYYAARLNGERPLNDSVEEQANSALRERFYRYAVQELDTAYVHDSSEGFDAEFPLLFRSTEELRQTELYGEEAYPVSRGDSVAMMHAWPGCPYAAGATENRSIAYLESHRGDFSPCPACGFNASSLGNVAAASTSIENGFEHHYRIVAEAARDYERCRSELDPVSERVKQETEGLLDRIKDAFSQASNARIKAIPPGRSGAIALVADLSSYSANERFPSSFVSESDSLGPRIAVSAAALARDSSDEGRTVLSSVFDGFGPDSGAMVGVGRIVVSVWSDLLGAYAQGNDAVVQALETGLDSIPLASESGLGTWASGRFTELVGDAGLEPADLTSAKAVLCNSIHPLMNGQDELSSRIMTVKARALTVGVDDSSLFDSALTQVEAAALESLNGVDREFTIASVVLVEGEVEFPVTITLPESLFDGAADAVGSAFDALRGLGPSISGERRWE